MIAISSLIAPVYHEQHDHIKNHRFTHYWNAGGRGSGKSSFISIQLVLGMLRDQNINTLVLRQNHNTLHPTVFQQILWAIDRLDMAHLVSYTKQPPRITFNPTGQQIIFCGMDDPQKLKGLKVRRGYIGQAWFEELAEMHEEDVRSITYSAMRGGDKFSFFYSYNPPKMASNWVNKAFLQQRPDRYSICTNYLQMPREWLGDPLIEEAESLRVRNELAYRNEFLGEVTGGGGQIFHNLEFRELSEQELKNNVDRWVGGVDFGFAVSPLAIALCGWNKTRNELYVVEEYMARNTTNEKCAELLLDFQKRYNLNVHFRWICDCAEPKSIDFLRRAGVPCIPCVKGPDSIRYGVHALQDMHKIIVDPKKCEKGMDQLLNYEYQRNRAGEWIDEYPTVRDDFVDAMRYAIAELSNAQINPFFV